MSTNFRDRTLVEQTDQTRAIREATWKAEMVGLRNRLEQEKGLNVDQKKNLADMISTLQTTGLAKMRAAWAKEDAATGEHLQNELDAESNNLEAKHALLDREIDQQEKALNKEDQQYSQHFAKLEQLRAQRHAKLNVETQAEYDTALANLQQHLRQIQAATSTSEERIRAEYSADAARFSAMEEKKALTVATSEAQRTQIATMYAAIRRALLGREQADLQALRNSQGWQGVLGAPFAAMIRGDERLWKEWASSANQSHMLVRASLEGLREVGQRTFSQFAQGMGQNIANALVYKKSVGEAMRSAMAATLESLAAEAFMYGIYATALGFLRLAQWDFTGAANAFTSAAIWGSVGAAAAVAGRVVAPTLGSQAGAASGGETASGTGSTGSNSGSGSSPVTVVKVYVQGHLVGWTHVDELTAAINDAVVNRDTTLTATNTKSGKTVLS